MRPEDRCRSRVFLGRQQCRTGSHGQSQIRLLFIGFTGQKRAGRAERNQSAHRIRVGRERNLNVAHLRKQSPDQAEYVTVTKCTGSLVFRGGRYAAGFGTEAGRITGAEPFEMRPPAVGRLGALGDRAGDQLQSKSGRQSCPRERGGASE